MATPDRSRVFLAEATDKREGIRKILGQFDLASDGLAALKANYNSDDPFPASTDPEILRHLVEGLKGLGLERIVMAERSGMGYTPDVLANRGVADLSRKLGFGLMVLDGWNPRNGWMSRMRASTGAGASSLPGSLARLIR